MGKSKKVKRFMKRGVSIATWGVGGDIYDKKKKVEDLTGETAARRAAKTARESMMRESQVERLRLAESEDELKRRRYLSRYGGRQSLMSSGGTTNMLGG